MILHFHYSRVPNSGDVKRIVNINKEMCGICHSQSIEVLVGPACDKNKCMTSDYFTLSDSVVKKHYLKMPSIRFVGPVITAIKMMKYVLRYRPSIVIVEWIIPYLFIEMCKILYPKTIVIADIHGAVTEEAVYLEPELSQSVIKRKRRSESYTVRKADYVICQSDEMCNYMNRTYGVPLDRIWVYRFVMPEHDSVVEFKVGDYLAPSMYASMSILDFDNVLYCPYRVVDGKGAFYVNTFRRFALNIKNTKGTTYKGDVIELLDSNGETLNKSKLKSMAIDDFPSENEETIYTLLFYVEGNYELNIKVDDLTYSIKFVCSDSKEDWPTFVSDIKTILGWPIKDKVTANNVTKVSLETNVSGFNRTANYSTDSEDIAKTVAIFDTAVFKIDYYSVGSGGANRTFSYYYNDKVSSFEVKDTFIEIENAKYLVDTNFYYFEFTSPVRM